MDRITVWVLVISLILSSGILSYRIYRNTEQINQLEHRIEQTETLLKGHLKMEH